uniref:NR LBD domain-containing protein n=1 Tax=Caenorhabditis japonica TaxID=281687 RepID=A0A8R1I1Y4_CAEJA
MTPENVQLDPNSDYLDEIAPDTSYKLALEPVQNSHLYQSLRNPKILIDVTPTILKLKTVLASSMPPLINSDYFKMNTLERMQFALWNDLSKRKFRDIKFEKVIVVEIPNKKWENDLLRIATWLLHSEHFRMLPLEEKMAIFKKVWMRWRKFEKWLISVDTFGQKVYKENVFVSCNYCAANLNNIMIDYSNITDRPNDEMNQLFGRQIHRMQREMAKPLADMAPSTIEMTYMLCQLVWNGLETELENYSINVGEAFLTEISENLHEHYAHQNISNYAWRLQKLMKIVNSVREIEREREEMMRLCELFDVFKIRLSDKDLFVC